MLQPHVRPSWRPDGGRRGTRRLRDAHERLVVRVAVEVEAGDGGDAVQPPDVALDQVRGRVPISWRYVSCEVAGPLVYRFKEGSNEFWTAVQVRNHRYAIARFEYFKDGGWVNVNRESYNYFVEPAGMGPGPYRFRVTDVYGQTVEDDGIPHREAAEVSGGGQLGLCR